MHGAYFPGYLGSDKFRVCHRVCHRLKSFWAEGASRAPDPEPTGISEACVAGAQGLGGDGGRVGGQNYRSRRVLGGFAGRGTI